MATIKPKVTIGANVNTASNKPGPMGTPISLETGTIELTVSDAEVFEIPNVRTTFDAADFAKDAPLGQVLLRGADFTASAHSSGTVLDHHGCWLYILNTTAATSKHIVAIGHTTDGDASTDGDNADGDNDASTGADLTPLVDGDNDTHANAQQRLFSLRAGEFAFFPYDYTGTLYCQATGANQSLEVWKFNRTE